VNFYLRYERAFDSTLTGLPVIDLSNNGGLPRGHSDPIEEQHPFQKGAADLWQMNLAHHPQLLGAWRTTVGDHSP
jgi:hypothetical protein